MSKGQNKCPKKDILIYLGIQWIWLPKKSLTQFDFYYIQTFFRSKCLT
jgi:hypothetical protein